MEIEDNREVCTGQSLDTSEILANPYIWRCDECIMLRFMLIFWIAKRETRTITISEGYPGNLPKGEYGVLEYYCASPDCDCRRVMLHVHFEQSGDFVAVINFGWESKRFYEKWLGNDDKDWIHELKGPSLNTASQQCGGGFFYESWLRRSSLERLRLFKIFTVQIVAY